MGHRVRIHRYGGYDQLKLESFDVRQPKEREVLIQVQAAGINYADCVVRMGLYRSAREYVGLPITPGFEVCGHVIGVGDGVTSHQLGDPVIAVTRFDGYSSHITIDEAYVFAQPEGWSTESSAGTLATYLTADYALYHLAHPNPGEHLLVHSAAGGVGSVLVQLAKTMQTQVTGVIGSTSKRAYLEALAPDHIIDKSSSDLEAAMKEIAPEGFDLILDANGPSTLGLSYENLRRPGKLVVYGFASMLPKSRGRANWLSLARDYFRTPRFNPLEMTTSSRSVLAFNLSYLFERTDLLAAAMQRFQKHVSLGELTPPECTVFPVEAVQEAHRAIESGLTTGKLVLTFEPG